MVEEEVMMQRWLLWLGTFDDDGGNDARPQQMKVIQHFVNFTLCKLPIWMWDAVSGGLVQPKP